MYLLADQYREALHVRGGQELMGRSFNGGPILRSPSFGSAGLAEPHNPPNNTRIQDPESGSDGLAMEFGSEESYHDSPPQSRSEDEDGG